MKWLRGLHRRLIRRKKRVYLRPTIAGLWWLGTLFILFLIGWGYSNNICLAIAMLILSVTMIILLEAHINIEALTIERLNVDEQFAGRPAPFQLVWSSRKKSTRRLISVEWDAFDMSVQTWPTPVWDGLQGEVKGVMVFPRRGHHTSRYVRLTSTYPLGLFHAWSYHPLECDVWVYPAPIENTNQFPGVLDDADAARLQGRGDGEEPVDFRRYSLGDPLSRVAWKVVARGLPAHTKLFESPQTERRFFRWPWGSGTEHDRGLVTHAIQTAFEAGESWSLETPQGTLDWGDDVLHRREGLRRLTEAP